MRKSFYYIIPFVIVPVALLLLEYIDNIGFIKGSPYIVTIMLMFVSSIVGVSSKTYNKFDYAMAIIMPLSLFCFIFISGFLGENDVGTRFHIDTSFRLVFQPIWLIEYCCMAISTFLSSHKKIRSGLQKVLKIKSIQ